MLVSAAAAGPAGPSVVRAWRASAVAAPRRRSRPSFRVPKLTAAPPRKPAAPDASRIAASNEGERAIAPLSFFRSHSVSEAERTGRGPAILRCLDELGMGPPPLDVLEPHLEAAVFASRSDRQPAEIASAPLVEDRESVPVSGFHAVLVAHVPAERFGTDRRLSAVRKS